MSDIGAIESGWWHYWHFAWKIGATSFENVTLPGPAARTQSRAGRGMRQLRARFPCGASNRASVAPFNYRVLNNRYATASHQRTRRAQRRLSGLPPTIHHVPDYRRFPSIRKGKISPWPLIIQRRTKEINIEDEVYDRPNRWVCDPSVIKSSVVHCRISFARYNEHCSARPPRPPLPNRERAGSRAPWCHQGR